MVNSSAPAAVESGAGRERVTVERVRDVLAPADPS
jgi:hypothetical protein